MESAIEKCCGTVCDGTAYLFKKARMRAKYAILGSTEEVKSLLRPWDWKSVVWKLCGLALIVTSFIFYVIHRFG